jgi:hypothetical protein
MVDRGFPVSFRSFEVRRSIVALRRASPPRSVLLGPLGHVLFEGVGFVVLDLAVQELDDAVGMAGDVLLVGHEDDSVAPLVELQ